LKPLCYAIFNGQLLKTFFKSSAAAAANERSAAVVTLVTASHAPTARTRAWNNASFCG
jgi:hypothetical protein